MLGDNAPGRPVNQAAAGFARNRLMQAMQQGLLPQNFNIAQTGRNVIGQFHQLNNPLNQAAVQTNPHDMHAIMNRALSGLNGGNNVVARGAQYGQMTAPHPLAAPMGAQPQGNDMMLQLGAGDPRAALLGQLFGQIFGGGNVQGYGA